VHEDKATDTFLGGFVVEGVTRALFRPVQFASVTARNRTVMAPMVTNFASPDDETTDRQVMYYAERARGGVGTIVVEASAILHDVRISSRQLGSYDDRLIPGLARLASAIKKEGAVALLQLCHGGPKIYSAGGLWTKSVSPVGIWEGDVPRSLSAAELRKVRRDFVAASRRACRAGFDGVELHAAHFYLLSASISPFTNIRTDEYGGSIVNRARLARETVEDIKAELGPEFPVWVRINACEELDPGLSLEEGQQVASIIAEAGADAIHVSAYTLPINKRVTGIVRIPVGAIPLKETPPGPFLDYAAAIRRVVDIPVIAVGKLDDPVLAAGALDDGKCDMIALARQLLCDPYWAQKVGKGRDEEIVHCRYCMTCHTAQQRGEDVGCAQNLNLYGQPVYKSHLAEGQRTKFGGAP
jgi:2,4-dienoyl-CoA reductase-like NADH-dependent reductase (Old Yellow Enzyme family)